MAKSKAIGRYWIDTNEHDQFVQLELERQGLSRLARPSKHPRYGGPNQRLVLRYLTGQAIIIFKRRKCDIGYTGMQCVLFVNNSKMDNASLIKDATRRINLTWGDLYKFVYLDPKVICDRTGKAFKTAGWGHVGFNAKGQKIFEFEQISDEDWSNL